MAEDRNLITGADRIRDALSWPPKHDGLDSIVRTALDWERRRLEQDPR